MTLNQIIHLCEQASRRVWSLTSLADSCMCWRLGDRVLWKVFRKFFPVATCQNPSPAWGWFLVITSPFHELLCLFINDKGMAMSDNLQKNSIRAFRAFIQITIILKCINIFFSYVFASKCLLFLSITSTFVWFSFPLRTPHTLLFPLFSPRSPNWNLDKSKG